jgi:hypothetical protein
VGTLVLSSVRVPNPMSVVRAAAWANRVAKLGVYLPLYLVHDFGTLLTTPRGGMGIQLGNDDRVLRAAGLTDEARAMAGRYAELINTVAKSELVEKAPSMRLRDELVAVLLVRIFGDLWHRFNESTKSVGVEELPLDPGTYAGADPVQHCRDFDQAPLIAFLRFLTTQLMHVYTSLEQIDLDTVRLLGTFGGNATGSLPPVDLVDLLGVFGSTEANDVVSFSLELLPSVLETKRSSGVQTFSVDGYASIERHGNPDSLILTEFATDEEIFEQKIIDNELYYYGHDKQREEERRLQYVLIDSSPSMRGVRQVFARGLALTLAKKMALQGDEVWLRFFDSRLYDVQKVTRGDFAVPYVLSWRSPRGRNYAKVFRQLAVELSKLRREERRQVIVYIVTHGQCHIPVDVVQQLRRDAFLYGIFILPSSDVTLDYLTLLHRHQIVSAEALSTRKGRKDRALEIVEDAGDKRVKGARVATAVVEKKATPAEPKPQEVP